MPSAGRCTGAPKRVVFDGIDRLCKSVIRLPFTAFGFRPAKHNAVSNTVSGSIETRTFPYWLRFASKAHNNDFKALPSRIVLCLNILELVFRTQYDNDDVISFSHVSILHTITMSTVSDKNNTWVTSFS